MTDRPPPWPGVSAVMDLLEMDIICSCFLKSRQEVLAGAVLMGDQDLAALSYRISGNAWLGFMAALGFYSLGFQVTSCSYSSDSWSFFVQACVTHPSRRGWETGRGDGKHETPPFVSGEIPFAWEPPYLWNSVTCFPHGAF